MISSTYDKWYAVYWAVERLRHSTDLVRAYCFAELALETNCPSSPDINKWGGLARERANGYVQQVESLLEQAKAACKALEE